MVFRTFLGFSRLGQNLTSCRGDSEYQCEWDEQFHYERGDLATWNVCMDFSVLVSMGGH